MNSVRICWRRRSSVASSRTTTARRVRPMGAHDERSAARRRRPGARRSPSRRPGTPSISSSARGSRNASMTVRPRRRPGFVPSSAWARSFARSIRRPASKCRTPTGSRSSSVVDGAVALVRDAPGLGPRLGPRPVAASMRSACDVVGAPPDDVAAPRRARSPARHRDHEHAVHAPRIAYARWAVRRLPDAAAHRDRARRTGRLELDRPGDRSGHRRAIDRRVAEPLEP